MIGVATTEKNGLMPNTQSSKTLSVIQNVEYGSIGRIAKGNNAAFLLSSNTNGYRGGLFYIYIDSTGSAHITSIENVSTTTFYEDDSYVYYKKRYGGTDSISPISNNTSAMLESITSLPAGVSELTKRQAFGYSTLEELAAALQPYLS